MQLLKETKPKTKIARLNFEMEGFQPITESPPLEAA
jgi:hypothetical protein